MTKVPGWHIPYDPETGIVDRTPTIVYRVEDRDGYGPYQEGSSVHDEVNFSARDGNLPPLHLDLPFEVDVERFPFWQTCGFRTREQAEWWFDGLMPYLEANGYRLVRYEVPAGAITDTVSGLQVAFDLDCAGLVTDWPEEEEAA